MQTCEQTRTKDTCHPSADLSWGGGAMILEWIFNRMGGCGLDLSSITIWTSDRLLWAEWWTLEFHRMQRLLYLTYKLHQLLKNVSSPSCQSVSQSVSPPQTTCQQIIWYILWVSVKFPWHVICAVITHVLTVTYVISHSTCLDLPDHRTIYPVIQVQFVQTYRNIATIYPVTHLTLSGL